MLMYTRVLKNKNDCQYWEMMLIPKGHLLARQTAHAPNFYLY